MIDPISVKLLNPSPITDKKPLDQPAKILAEANIKLTARPIAQVSIALLLLGLSFRNPSSII